MSVVFYENALKALKKANSVRKQKLAEKAGFQTINEYLSFLEGQISNGKPEEKVEEVEEIKEILIVDVLDRSSSMVGSKLTNAVKGIKKGIIELRKETRVKYNYMICDFSNSYNIKISRPLPISKVKEISNAVGGTTALYDAIGKTIAQARKVKGKDEKVLINIYTDGGENDSRYFKAEQIERLINEVEKEGFTVTFVGTKHDAEQVERNLNIKSSNINVYDGSAKGLQDSIQATIKSRAAYTTKVVNNESVVLGFYKDVTN